MTLIFSSCHNAVFCCFVGFFWSFLIYQHSIYTEIISMCVLVLPVCLCPDLYCNDPEKFTHTLPPSATHTMTFPMATALPLQTSPLAEQRGSGRVLMSD